MAGDLKMTNTIAQAKALIRSKFDHADKMANKSMASRGEAAELGEQYEVMVYNDAYHYWLGKRAILAELLTSIDEA